MQKINLCVKNRYFKNHIGAFLIFLLICIMLTGCSGRFNYLRYGQSSDNLNQHSADKNTLPKRKEWYLTLVNRQNPLKADNGIKLTTLANGQQVDSRIYPHLQAMFDDMRMDGVYPTVVSGYRTEEKQTAIYNEKIKSYRMNGYSKKGAIKEAEKWVAVPGTSEHQLGLAVDINADGIHSAGNEVYRWLDANAWRYGFIKRYPPDKTEITGVSGEPWHYRYVGIDAAAEMHERGVCLEEYLLNWLFVRSNN